MKEHVLHTSTELFLTRGFKSVTMDDIAAEMGISKKTIYTHYTNKTDLVKATAKMVMERIFNAIEQCELKSENPIQELFDIKDVVTDLLKDESSSPQFQMQKYYPKIYKDLMKNQFSCMIQGVERNLQKGVEMGLYRREINIPFIARLYFGGTNFIKNQELFPYEQFPKKMVKDAFLEYHLRGIITPKGEEILNSIITN